MLDLDFEIRQKTKIYDEKMHELFHIIALAVKGSNPHNQPHLKAQIKKGSKLGLKPEEIAEALMVCVNPGGAMVQLTVSHVCLKHLKNWRKKVGKDKIGKLNVSQRHRLTCF